MAYNKEKMAVLDFIINDNDFSDDYTENYPEKEKEHVEEVIIKKISLNIEKKASLLDKLIVSEVIDINCLNTLTKSDLLHKTFDENNYSQQFASTIYTNVVNQLETYFTKCYDKKNNVFDVEYSKPRHKWGRVFPMKALGLTSFSRKTRNTLIKNTYIDLDISNAQPAILHNVCLSNDIPCPIITRYINDRENILSDVMNYYHIDRNVAKKMFLRLSFFGCHKNFLKELDLNPLLKPLPYVSDYINELAEIADKIKKENMKLYETARKQNKTNTIGSFFSLYLQEYETRIMECAINWLNTKTEITTYKDCKNKVLTYEFDGLKLLKENVDKYGLEKLKNDIEKVILNQTGFNIKFEEKPIDNYYDILYTPYEPIQPKEQSTEYNNNILIEQEEYYYDDYRQFIKQILTTNGVETHAGLLFKEYYKQVFVKVDCGGKTKYFSKTKKDGVLTWVLLPKTPFGEKISKFYFYTKLVAGGQTSYKRLEIDIFISNLDKEDMTIYNDVDFMPYLYQEEVDDQLFNLFTGYNSNPLNEEVEPTYFDNIQPVILHLKEVLCNNDEKIYDYVIKWIAHLIQRPRDKDGVPAIYMKSDEGTGKNIFWDFIGQVIGKKYYTTINDLDSLTNKFNSRTEGKLLTLLNEIQNYGGNFKNNDKLKSIISDLTQTIEPKGKEAYEINNFSRFVMLTNNEWGVRVSNGDRRYVVINVSNHKKGDNDYFNNLVEVVKNEKNIELFFQYVCQLDISEFVIRTIPETQLRNDMKWNNLENRPLFHLKDYITDLKNNNEEPETKFFSEDLFNHYKEWCSENNERMTFSRRTYSTQLQKYGLKNGTIRIDAEKKKGFIITLDILKSCIENTLKITNYVFDE